jgi:alkylhydroperoxidase/carboxymuconolactone decarboxylase family protein YurZ
LLVEIQSDGTLPMMEQRPEVATAVDWKVQADLAPGIERRHHPDRAMNAETPTLASLPVEETERLLRRLALNDEASVAMVLTSGYEARRAALLPKVNLLVQLGALLALGAATSSLQATVDRAMEAGATESEIVGVLIAVAPAVGLARVVSTAPRLAMAIGYDIEADG